MRNWLKWVFARREMEELERWRVQYVQHRQWFAEFKPTSEVLDHLHDEVYGVSRQTIRDLRDSHRDRQSRQN